MHLLYQFPNRIDILPSGATTLDWGGRNPFDQESRLVTNPALAFPRVLPNAFTSEECQQVIALAESLNSQAATVEERGDVSSRDYRIGSIAWIEPDPPAQWLFHRLGVLFKSVNAASYGFELAGFAEALQYTVYSPGQYFNWHADIGPGTTSLRKLSLTIQLSSSTDYEGGDLQFHGATDMPIARELGCATFFPAYLAHQVAPITSGRRRSLVAWAYGPAFR